MDLDTITLNCMIQLCLAANKLNEIEDWILPMFNENKIKKDK